MKVICLEDEASYKLLDIVVTRLKEKHDKKEDKWICARGNSVYLSPKRIMVLRCKLYVCVCVCLENM